MTVKNRKSRQAPKPQNEVRRKQAGRYSFYRKCYRLARFFIGIFYRINVSGAGSIPSGAILVCANHSSNLDPFLIAFAFGINCHMHIIAKAELFRIPIISVIMRRLGMISVDRGILDLTTVKESLGYLKTGEKVVIFPEGTRAASDDAIAAKMGAIKLAERAEVPITPVHVPRKKRLFGKINIIIGEPYLVSKQAGKRSNEEYESLTIDLMTKIRKLGSSKP